MQLPDAATVDPLVERMDLPRLARVRYDPPTPLLEDVGGATATALEALEWPTPPGSVGILLGSRGITDIGPIAEAAVDWAHDAGWEPIVLPAMGSHGGATPAGQADVLAALGLTEERLGCPIDSRMETADVDTVSLGGQSIPVAVARAARELDVVVPINRIKPHTSFTGHVESGIAKMLVVGVGKRAGARRLHRYGRTHGFVTVIEALVPSILDEISTPGGIGIVENAAERTAEIVPIPAGDLLETESAVLERAREHLATLPNERIDLLIVDELGKDISGTGMDTNVIGRTMGDGTAPPGAPRIGRIYVRALTDATGGNGHGIGFADAIHRDVLDGIDLAETYTNALTSGAPRKVAIPLALPSDEHAINALIASLGAIPPADLRVAWIQNTGDLGTFRVSTALFDAIADPDVSLAGRERMVFDGGRLVARPATDP